MEHRELMLLFSDLFDDICNEIAYIEGWNEDTDWNEHTFIEIEPLAYDDDLIDGLLFFADGTVEFHLEKEQDALTWHTFSPKIIEDVLVRLRNKI
jgi:hypothetical protein